MHAAALAWPLLRSLLRLLSLFSESRSGMVLQDECCGRRTVMYSSAEQLRGLAYASLALRGLFACLSTGSLADCHSIWCSLAGADHGCWLAPCLRDCGGCLRSAAKDGERLSAFCALLRGAVGNIANYFGDSFHCNQRTVVLGYRVGGVCAAPPQKETVGHIWHLLRLPL